MFARIHRLVLLRVVSRAAGRDGLDEGVAVRVPEPGDGVARGDGVRDVGVGFVEGGGLDDAVLGGFEGVVEPAGEEVADCGEKGYCQSYANLGGGREVVDL